MLSISTRRSASPSSNSSHLAIGTQHPFALPDTLAFQRRPARSPSTGRRTSASRSAHASPARGGSPSVPQIPLPSKFAPQPRQQQHHPRRPRHQVIDVSYAIPHQDRRPSSPPLLPTTRMTNKFVDPQQRVAVPADKVYISTYYPDFTPASSSYSSSSASSPRTKASRLPLWNDDSNNVKDDISSDDIPAVIKQSKQWQDLMAPPKPSPKGKQKATDRHNDMGAIRDYPRTGAGRGRGRTLGQDSNASRTTKLTTPQIEIVSATYQAQSPLQAGVRPSYFDHDLSPPSSQRSKSLSPFRGSSSSPTSSSSASSSSSSSRSTSPSSSTSTLVTDPDPSPRASNDVVVVVGAEGCQSPRCFRTHELSLTVEDSDETMLDIIGGHATTTNTTSLITFGAPAKSSSLFAYGTTTITSSARPTAYVRVPFGRDPLSRGPTRLNMTDLASPISEKINEEEPSSAASLVGKSKTAAKITSLLYSALDALASLGVGQIMVDGYTTSGNFDEEDYAPITTPEKRMLQRSATRGRKIIVERDSLGLEKATLSPGSPTASPSLLFGTTALPDTPAPAAKSPSPTRPWIHTRRRSLRHVSSDPVLYYNHGRAPSIQKRKQAFGPLDIKPYGYRVGVSEVTAVFGSILEEKRLEQVEGEKRQKREGSASPRIGAAILDMLASASAAAMMMEGEAVAATGSSMMSTSALSSPKSSPSRPPSPPTPACVALQRYPIIPYNPPGPGVSAEDELFPKVRNLTKGRLWYLDLIPGGSDGKVDGAVPLSYQVVDDAGVLFGSFPDPLRGATPVGLTHYGLKQAQYTPARRRPSEGDRRRVQRSRSAFPDIRNASDRARSPSPQRGRPRNVRPVTGSQRINIPTQLKPLSPSPPPTPSPRARALTVRPGSAKHFRSPPLADSPSMYLLWAVKGSILALPPQQQSSQVDAAMEGWNGVVVRRSGGNRSTSAAGGGIAKSSGGNNGSRRSGPAGAEGLRGAAKRRMGEDGRIWSALRWEVPLYGSSDLEDEDDVPEVEDGERA